MASTQTVMLKNAGAREIATSLQALVGSGGGEGGAAAPATVVPIDSSHCTAIRGDADTVTRLANMARALYRQAASGSEIRVYWRETATAAQLFQVCRKCVGPSVARAAGSAPACRTRV